MSSSTVAGSVLGWPQQPRIETPEECTIPERDVANTGQDMPPRRHTGELEDYDEVQERRDFRLAVMALVSRETTRPSEMKRLWLPICAAVLISLGPPLWTATVMTRSTSDEFKNQLAEVKTLILEAKRDAGDAAREAKRANVNYALLDVYNRELERSLIRKGIALPTYPTLEK